MTVKVIELIGISEKSFEDALNEGLQRACQTIRGVTGIDVVGQSVVVKEGKIIEYRVNLKVAFVLE